MFMSHVSKTDFIKIDNARSLEFLSALAGVCSRHEILSEKALENFRIELGSLHLHDSSRGIPLLLKLIENENELLSLMLALYGEQALMANLLRHTLKAQCQDLSEALKDFTQTICDKAKLKMNEEVAIFRWRRFEGTSLLGSELLSGAEAAAQVLGELRDLTAKINKAVSIQVEMPQNSQSLATFDEDARQALGFAAVDEQAIYNITSDSLHIEDLANTISRFFRNLQTWLQPLEKSFRPAAWLSASLQCQELDTTVKTLVARVFRSENGLTVHEVNREKIMQTLYDVTQGLHSLSELLTESIASSISKSTPLPLMSEQQSRSLSLSLLSKGAKSKPTREAIEALQNYLLLQGLRSHELLDAEIKDLHPVLSENYEVIQPYLKTRPQGDRLLQIKKSSLRRHDALIQLISGIGLCVLFFAFSTLGSFSCGIKKSPVSSIETLRPSIPFRIYQNQPAISSSTPAASLDATPTKTETETKTEPGPEPETPPNSSQDQKNLGRSDASPDKAKTDTKDP